jgi:hypothetical protein
MILLAHGDLMVDLPIFLGPVAVLAAWLAINVHRGRRRR